MLIGISGKIGSGKDTVGLIIQALTMQREIGSRYKDDPVLYVKNYEGRPNLKGGYEIKKFAYKLKQIVSILTGIPVEDLEKHEVKDRVLGKEWYTFISLDEVLKTGSGRRPYTVRELLQRIGTDAMRNIIHPNIWVNALFADYKPVTTTESFYNEEANNYTGITNRSITKDLNWIITDVRFPNEADAILERGGIMIRVERPGLVENTHLSETALDNYSKFNFTINNNGTMEELVLRIKEVLKEAKILTN